MATKKKKLSYGEEQLERYERFWQRAGQKGRQLTTKFTDKWTFNRGRGDIESTKKTTIEEINIAKKELEKIKRGEPIFSISGMNFSIGTTYPSLDEEEVPAYIKMTTGKIFFGFDKKTFEEDIVDLARENLGSKKKKIKNDDILDATEESLMIGPDMELEYRPRNIVDENGKPIPPKKAAEELAKRLKAYQDGTDKAKKSIIKREEARIKYPFSFPLKFLIRFINSVQEVDAAIALALIKVYFGPRPGANVDCPELLEIAGMSKNTSKITSQQKTMIHKFVKPLIKYKTKKRGFSFRAHQLIGIAFWKAAGGRAMIGDEMGVGKTVQAIGAILLTSILHKKSQEQRKLAAKKKKKPLPQVISSPFPALIICPKGLLGKWEDDIKEWIPWANVLSEGTTGSAIKKVKKQPNQIIITTYSTLRDQKDWVLQHGFKFLVIDESQAVKNPRSGQTKAAIDLSKTLPYVMLLSGTPEEKDLEDLWSQMHIIRPDRFPSISQFVGGGMDVLGYKPAEQRKVKGGKKQTVPGLLKNTFPFVSSLYGGKKIAHERYPFVKNSQFLFEPPVTEGAELFAPLKCHMIRRLKNDVLGDLPPKQRVVLVNKLSPQAKKFYEKLEQNIADRMYAIRIKKWAMAVASQTKTGMAKGMSKAKAKEMALKDPEIEKLLSKVTTEEKKQRLAMFGELRRQMGIINVPIVTNWVKRFYQDRDAKKEPLLIFAEHKKIINDLQKNISALKDKKGKKLVVKTYTGSTNDKLRRSLPKDFQNGKIDVLIINKAGNTGLDLYRARYVVFAERFWNPGQEEQAEDRVHRSGQKRPVTIYYFNTRPWTSKIDGKEVSVNPIDNRLNEIVERKRRNIKQHIGLVDYQTKENDTTKNLTKQIVASLESRFNRQSIRKQEKEALDEAFRAVGIGSKNKAPSWAQLMPQRPNYRRIQRRRRR